MATSTSSFDSRIGITFQSVVGSIVVQLSGRPMRTGIANARSSVFHLVGHAARFVESELERRERGSSQVLIEDRSQVLLDARVEEPHDVLGHDVLVLELLVEVAHQRPPGASSLTTLRSVFRTACL